MRLTIPYTIKSIYLVLLLFFCGLSAVTQAQTPPHREKLQLSDSLHRQFPQLSAKERNKWMRKQYREQYLDDRKHPKKSGKKLKPEKHDIRKKVKHEEKEDKPLKKRPERISASSFTTFRWQASLNSYDADIAQADYDQVPDSLEYKALKALFESTQGTGWINKEHWPYQQWPEAASVTWYDFALWYGIDVEHGDVVNIKLSGNNLIGTLPEQMQWLTACGYLELDDNRITGLAAEVGNMSSLSTLYLSNNQLTSLPESFGNLSALRVLDLEQNRLTSLPESFGQLSNLYYLYLSDNQLTTLPVSISGLTGLDIFNVDRNQLTSLPSGIGQMSSLTNLAVSYNRLTSVPDEIGGMTSLETATFSHNALSALPASMSTMSSLYHLSISDNIFTALPSVITQLGILSTLRADNNQISNLPVDLGSLTEMTDLSMANNQFTSFPFQILDLPYLMELDLSGNAIASIPEDIGQLYDLTFLFLNSNQLAALPDALSTMPWLWSLKIADNPFATLPPVVTQCVELLELDISRLNLSELPEALRTDLPYLAYLDANGNALDFADLEPFYTAPQETFLEELSFQDQQPFGTDTTLMLPVGALLDYSLQTGGEHNVYTWQRQQQDGTWLSMQEGLSNPKVSKKDDGLFRLRVSNSWVPGEMYSASLKMDIYYQNFVLEEDVLQENVMTLEEVQSLNRAGKNSTWTYYDGMQKPLQQIAAEASPSGKDIIQVQNYDALGRQPKSYLSYTKNNIQPGEFRGNPIAEQQQFYQTPPTAVVAEPVYTYAETQFEASPLSRVEKQGAPGTAWNLQTGATTSQQYETNTANEVLYWTLNNELPKASAYYTDGELSKIVSTDADGNQAIAYIDKQGRSILQKTHLEANVWAETYTVYDIYGQVRYQVTPKAMASLGDAMPASIDQAMLDALCFQYNYDNQGRVIKKKAPGMAPVQYVYDQWDRLVLSQDGNQQANNLWSFTKYDVLDRPVISGQYQDTRTAEQLRDALSTETQRYESYDATATQTHGYTNQAFPRDQEQVWAVSYYDDYAMLGDQSLPQAYRYKADALQGLPGAFFFGIQGLPTASKTNVLGTEEFLWTITYYDEDLRPVQIVADNHLGGIDRLSSLHNFPGWLMQSKLVHNEGQNNELNLARRQEYDPKGRLLKQYHQINAQPEVLLAEYSYNELDQVVAKKLHGKDDGSFLQSIDYRYNIQGWLTEINTDDLSLSDGDYFGMKLHYQQAVSELGNQPKLNGNITATSWQQQGEDRRAYTYGYDQGQRLTSAQHHEKQISWDSKDDYSVSGIKYDENGNIQTLNRNGSDGNAMDALSYTYDQGNQLQSVTDAGDVKEGFKDGNTSGDDYTYDANGNLTKDLNKGISELHYNHLNKVSEVIFEEGLRIEYAYDAAGNKLSQSIYPADGSAALTTDYLGEIVYYNDQVQFIHHEEGRLVPRAKPDGSTTFIYDYDLHDHLGNVRVTFTSEPTTQAKVATAEDAYYAYEQSEFLDLSSRTQTIAGIDHTKTEANPKVFRLNSGRNAAMKGPAKTLQVFPGDQVTMEVYVKYLDMRVTDPSLSAGALILGILQATTGTVPGDPSGAYYGTSPASSEQVAALGTGNNGAPTAYLNYYLYDRQFNEVSSDAMQVPASAAITMESFDSEHAKLSMTVDITQAGYLMVNLSHDAAENIDIYFDDFAITHTHGNIVQVQDYYPYGMTFAQMMPEHCLLNQYLYQEKERLDSLGVDDFHARLYDPALGRFLGSDPQSQFASGYVGMGNNPVMYVDPDGEFAFLAAAAVAYLLFTETGYDIQKHVSPVALHIDVNLGTHQKGIGFDASVGIPKIAPISYRVHGGASYYWKNYDITPGWETRYGSEWGLLGLVSVGGTRYNSPGTKFDQTTNHVMIGNPLINIKYENDWFFDLKIPMVPNADGGDRYRTAAAKVKLGAINIGINLFTGDPGFDGNDRITQRINGKDTYVRNPLTGDDPDEFRAGVGYIGIGPFRFGNDTENRRHKIQNQLVHDNIGSPYFRVLERRNKWFFQFGGGNGRLW